MSSQSFVLHDKIWLDKPKYDAAERRFYEKLSKTTDAAGNTRKCDSSSSPESSSNGKKKKVTRVVNNSIESNKQTPKGVPFNEVSKVEDIPVEETDASVCSIKHDLSSPEKKKLIDNSKTVSGLDINDSDYPPLSVAMKEFENSCPIPQTKGEVCLKQEKPKDSNSGKSVSTVKKNETCDVSCAKPKNPIKLKIVDEINAKQDLEKVKGGIDPVAEVVKGVTQNTNSWNSLAGEVAKARQHIKNSLQCIENISVTSNEVSVEITNRLNALEKENQDLKTRVTELSELVEKMEIRISSVEKTFSAGPSQNKAPAPAPPKKDDAEDDDGVDLFGSDSEEEDAEAAKIKEQRLAEYAARKAKKPVLIAKSNIILDVKPWDDETNMKELEAEVRKISTDGLVWGASKLVPLAYGIHKLQISCVVEDEKVSVDWLQEVIQEIEDYVQSVDIAAFNKV